MDLTEGDPQSSAEPEPLWLATAAMLLKMPKIPIARVKTQVERDAAKASVRIERRIFFCLLEHDRGIDEERMSRRPPVLSLALACVSPISFAVFSVALPLPLAE